MDGVFYIAFFILRGIGYILIVLYNAVTRCFKKETWFPLQISSGKPYIIISTCPTANRNPNFISLIPCHVIIHPNPKLPKEEGITCHSEKLFVHCHRKGRRVRDHEHKTSWMSKSCRHGWQSCVGWCPGREKTVPSLRWKTKIVPSCLGVEALAPVWRRRGWGTWRRRVCCMFSVFLFAVTGCY